MKAHGRGGWRLTFKRSYRSYRNMLDLKEWLYPKNFERYSIREYMAKKRLDHTTETRTQTYQTQPLTMDGRTMTPIKIDHSAPESPELQVRQQLLKAQALARRLKPFIKHVSWCAFTNSGGKDGCNCGLYEAINHD